MSTLTTLAMLAETCQVDKSTVSRHVARLGVGTRIGPMITLTLSEARAVRKAIEDARPGNPNAATARLGKTLKNKPNKKR